MRHDAILTTSGSPARRIACSASAARLLARYFERLAHEELWCLHLDADFRLIHRAHIGGDVESVAIPLRALVRDALIRGTRALILAHNHPGGAAAPSNADREATRRLIEIVRPLDIRVVDHLIFAGGGWTSFRRLGFL